MTRPPVASSVAAVSSPWSTRRTLANVVIYFGAMFAGAWLLGPELPFPNVPAVGERFHYFAEHRDDFDTLFIGSSRFRHQIIPAEFEAQTQAGGVTTRAFNLGYSGMWPPESFYFLRQVLALKPARLKWVVIELMDYRYGPADDDKPSARTSYWHDGEHTAMALQLMWELPLSMGRRLELCTTHTWLYLQQLLHPGCGADWLQSRLLPVRKEKTPRWARRGGYEAQEGETWSADAQASFARQVEAVRAPLPPQVVRPGFAAALRAIVEDVRHAGAEPLFVIPPTVHPEENLALGLPQGLRVFAFNRPDDYPILYEYTTHYDPGHLNEKGAMEFTRLLAGRFLREVRPR